MSSFSSLRRLVLDRPDRDSELSALCERQSAVSEDVERSVREILVAVRTRGDAAVREYTERFDGRPCPPGGYEIDPARWAERASAAGAEVRAALACAAERIRAFHRPQAELGAGYDLEGGTVALRRLPLRRVGLYVPGGTARYPSSVLMTAIPARLAGVAEIVMVTPGASPETLAAATQAGVDRVFEIGGAQAIAALAFGTETVPRVDKIVGPGNQWVAAAKRQVYGAVDIDSIAGPSELMILADDSAQPDWVAADLLAQAEHDTEARAILVTTSAELPARVDLALSRQLADLRRRAIAEAALCRHGVAVICVSLAEAVAIANRYAPEHLELCVARAEEVAGEVHGAAAVFIGSYSPEALGDYVAGPNHVLPTGGAARFSSPLGVYDFCKYVSVVHFGREELAALRGSIEALAEVEGLGAHARSVQRRFEREGAGG